MGYKKISKTFKEYSGESFAQSIKKDSGSMWTSNEVAVYNMYDSSGVVVSTGSVDKSSDSRSMGFLVPKSDTASLVGKCIVLVELGDTNNAEVGEIIAEYEITYSARTAT